MTGSITKTDLLVDLVVEEMAYVKFNLTLLSKIYEEENDNENKLKALDCISMIYEMYKKLGSAIENVGETPRLSLSKFILNQTEKLIPNE